MKKIVFILAAFMMGCQIWAQDAPRRPRLFCGPNQL